MAVSDNDRKPNSLFSSVIRGVGMIVVIAGILLCLLLTVPRLLGITGYVVLTGSMEPKIPVGSLVYVKETDPSQLSKGEVILFYSAETGEDIPIAHRVVENRTGDGTLITKGDANEKEDIAPVRYENVIGKVVRSVPGLGRLVAPLSTMTGKIGLFLIVLAGLILMEIGKKLRE
jgi:signal peptidase